MRIAFLILAPLVLANVLLWALVAKMPIVSIAWLILLWIAWRLVRAEWEGRRW